MVRVPYLKPAQTSLRYEKTELSFADFGDPRRPNTAQSEKSDFKESPNPLIQMARREGFAREQSSLCEPTSAQSGSTRLGHKMAEFEWHAGRDSNPRPSGSKKAIRVRSNAYLR